MSRGDWTHKLTYKTGEEFLAYLDTSTGRMYHSEVRVPGSEILQEADSYECGADSVEDHFCTPSGWWCCVKLNKFKGNK